MPNTPAQDKLLATLRKQFDQDCADEKHLREEAELDLRYVAGDQWNEALKQDRIRNGRPALTFARCHTFVQQVANEARQNKPQIKYIPAEDGDEDTAEVYEGLARHIQYSSEAQEAFETAVDYSAGGGFGYFRYLTDYCEEDGWDQDLKVTAVHDPFAVYGILIPACFGMEPKHAFVIEEIPIDDFKAENPDVDVTSFDGDSKVSPWIGTETVRVAEYWYIEEKSEEISRKNPTSGEEETRTISRKTVRFFKTNGKEILPGTETVWPDYCIPIFPVLGKKLIVKRKPYLFSVVRFQRDPQQLINIYKTRIAETLAVAPVQPFMVARGQVTDANKANWLQANRKLFPYLEYETVDLLGKPAPPPQRQVFEAPIASLSEAAAQEIDDMKATAGIYDASLGSKGNETSGIAIQRRQQQTNVTNLHFMDNLERSFNKGGKAMARLIPVVYDGARMVRILGEDETPKVVKINQAFKEGDNQKHYKIGGDGVGKYDVVVTMGRAFSTKRLESFDMMSQVVQAAPEILPMVGDILFKNSDMAGADQLAERFQKMLPPNLQDQEDGDQVIPPQVAQTLQAMKDQHEQMTQALQSAQQEIQTQQSIKQVALESAERMQQNELQSRERTELAKHHATIENEQLKAQVNVATTSAKTDSAEAIAAFNGEVQLLLKNIDAQQKQLLAQMGHEAALAAKQMEGTSEGASSAAE